jgi:hypothetical protein
MSSKPDPEPENLCMICYENNDDGIVDGKIHGMCSHCGQRFCGICMLKLKKSGNSGKCPKCQQSTNVSHKERVRLLQILIHDREPGKHTLDGLCCLGSIFEYGEGVQVDLDKAARLFGLSAKGGHAMAQCNLGIFYRDGKGVKQNDAEALRLFRISAEQDFFAAQHNLGVMYHEGRGVDQDYFKSMQWFSLSAEQGYSDAEYNLAGMYYRGEGCLVDYTASATWCKRAADKGNANAIKYIPQAISSLFPSGVRVKLVKMPAVMLNGIQGTVNSTPDGKLIFSGVGKISIMLDGRGTKSVSFENLSRI